MSVIEQRMADALSARLKRDRPNRFDPETWLEDTLDEFYPDEAFVDLVILQETQRVCSEDELILPGDAKSALAAEVNLGSPGQAAVDGMVDAYAHARPNLSATATTSNQLLSQQLNDLTTTIAALGSSTEKVQSAPDKSGGRKRKPKNQPKKRGGKK
jgi:hypothetical protein